MSTSDKAGDPAEESSMDDILASIRKIIADDPNAPRAGRDARATNPLLEPATQAAASPRDFGTSPLLPPAERFGDVLRSTTDAIRAGIDSHRAVPAVRSRPFTDRSLDELFDDGQTAEANAPPVAPSVSATLAAAVAPPVMAPEATASTTSALQPAGAVAQEVPSAGMPSRDPWSAWRNLRTETEPVSVSTPADAAQAASVVTAAVPAVGTQPAPAAAKPAAPSAAANTPPTSAAPQTQAAKPGFYPPSAPPAAPRRQNANFATAFPKAAADGTPSNGDAPPAEPRAPAPAAALNGTSIASTEAARADLNGNALQGTALLPAAPEAGPSAAAVEETAAAASQALQKLNAGLAETSAAAIAAAAPVATVQPAAPSASGSAPTRTLDDMVSDMLRPMLEKWVEANMPRLMEKALRPPSPKDMGPPKA